jgi:hypothetical protein
MSEHDWQQFIANTLANTPSDWGRADKQLLQEVERAAHN